MNSNIVGVVGSGTMGNGISHVFAVCNKVEQVILIDLNQEILENAKNIINNNLNRQVKKNIISPSEAQDSIKKIKFSTSILELKNVDIVIEAVKEDVNIKQSVFKELDKITSENVILATNTSSISIDDIAMSVGKKENVIGMHFMNPVPIMKLVEVIKGSKTSQSTIDKTLDYVSFLGKTPICCNDSPGFVSNRVLMPMINEAAFTCMEGVATPEAIDEIMKLGMGHPMGPLKLADLIGIDVCVSIMKVLYNGFKNLKYKVCPLLEDMVNKNKLGIKTGEGFYKY